MPAREGIACCGDFGIARGLNCIRADPGAVGADRQLDDTVYHFAAPEGGQEAVSPFLVNSPIDQVRQQRHDDNGKLADAVENLIQHSAERDTGVLKEQQILQIKCHGNHLLLFCPEDLPAAEAAQAGVPVS